MRRPLNAGARAALGADAVTLESMIGTDQEHWLLAGMSQSTARWNVIAQQVLMAQLARQVGTN